MFTKAAKQTVPCPLSLVVAFIGKPVWVAYLVLQPPPGHCLDNWGQIPFVANIRESCALTPFIITKT